MADKYICYKKFEGKVIADPEGKDRIFNEGEEFPLIAGLIAFPEDNTMKGICKPDSYNGHRHFAINNDGRGLERARLFSLIAFSDRKRQWSPREWYRFSREEYNTIKTKWKHFTREEHKEVLIFGHNLFHASVEELEELAKYLKMI